MAASRDALETIERRSYTTYLARLRAHQRLATWGHLWTVCLATCSVAAVILSITSLAYPTTRAPHIDYVALLISLAMLVASLVVALFNFGGRSTEMKHAYRRAQRLSVRAESMQAWGHREHGLDLAKETERLESDYQDLLDESENHSTADYLLRLFSPIGRSGPSKSRVLNGGEAPPAKSSESPSVATEAPPGDVAAGWRTISAWGWMAILSSGIVTLVPVAITILVTIATCAMGVGSLP